MIASSTAQSQKDRVNKTAQAVRICILMTLLILFNAYPEKVGVYRTWLDPAGFRPLLAAGFYSALPWLNAYLALALGLASVLLFRERWTADLRLADLALDLFGILVVCRLLAGGSLVGLGWNWPVTRGLYPFAGFWLPSLNSLVRLALWVWLIGLLIGALQKLVRLLPGWRRSQSGTARP